MLGKTAPHSVRCRSHGPYRVVVPATDRSNWIANAIDDAVGVRLTEMPLNPEAVYRAIRAKMGNPLEEQ